MTISIFGRGGRRRLAGKHHARHAGGRLAAAGSDRYGTPRLSA